MTIQRGDFELKCDECEDTEDLGTKDFDDAKEEVDRLETEEGWTTLKRGANYRHVCPRCS